MIRRTTIRATTLAAALSALLVPALPVAGDTHAEAARGRGRVSTATSAPQSSHEDRYLVTASQVESCAGSMDEVAKDAGKLEGEGVEWGCIGEHTAILTVTAKSPEEAIANLPEAEWQNARAVKLVRLAPKRLDRLHGGK